MASNTLLVGLLVISLVLSIASLYNVQQAPITGRAADTGSTALVVNQVTEVNFTTDLVNFSSGSVASGGLFCDLNTTSGSNDTGNCRDFTLNQPPFTLENIGNTNVTVDLLSEFNASGLLGGTNAVFNYRIINNGSEICANATPTTYTAVNTTTPGTRVCAFVNGTGLRFINSNDSISIDIALRVPYDSKTGLLTSQFTATATA